MELAVICGAVLAGRSLLNKPKEKLSENDDEGLLAIDDAHMKDLRRGGLVAGKYNSRAARVPFNTSKPPYEIWRPTHDEDMHNPTEDIYRHVNNSYNHHRDDFEEQNKAMNQYFISKRGGAIPVMFSREIHNIADPSMSTGIVDWSWVPPNPTDYDFVRAGEMAKRLPRHPNQFTPDATYFAAQGLTWRHRHR